MMAVRKLDLHVALADYLAVAYHVTNGELRDKATAAKLTRMGVRPGVPDFAVAHDGRALFLEAKNDSGRLSLDQRAMHSALIDAGAEVAVVRSVEDAGAVLGAWGMPLRPAFAATGRSRSAT